jgi:hypothetical protein
MADLLQHQSVTMQILVGPEGKAEKSSRRIIDCAD